MDARPFCRALRPGFAGLGFLGFLVAKQPLPKRGLRLRLVRNVLLTWVRPSFSGFWLRFDQRQSYCSPNPLFGKHCQIFGAVRPEIRLGVVGVCMANVSDQLTARSFTEAACENKQDGDSQC
jgi:hypothetical protein